MNEVVTVPVQLPNTDIVGFMKIWYGDEITIQLEKTDFASELKHVFLSDQARSLVVDLRPNLHEAIARNVEKPLVHDHGPEEDDGLDCREERMPDGSIKGVCVREDSSLATDLTSLLNKYSAESISGTPDFILSKFLIETLKAYNEAVSKRAEWRGEPIDFSPKGVPLKFEGRVVGRAEVNSSGDMIAWLDPQHLNLIGQPLGNFSVDERHYYSSRYEQKNPKKEQ